MHLRPRSDLAGSPKTTRRACRRSRGSEVGIVGGSAVLAPSSGRDFASGDLSADITFCAVGVERRDRMARHRARLAHRDGPVAVNITAHGPAVPGCTMVTRGGECVERGMAAHELQRAKRVVCYPCADDQEPSVGRATRRNAGCGKTARPVWRAGTGKRSHGGERGTGPTRKPPDNSHSPHLRQGAPLPDSTMDNL